MQFNNCSTFCYVSLVILRYYNNAYYAKVGGITTIEMNFLEVDFLFGLGFHLNVTPGTFQAYCAHLQREMLMMQPQLDFADSSLSLGKSLKTHLCFNDDESPHQKQQQLAVWYFIHFLNACVVIVVVEDVVNQLQTGKLILPFYLSLILSSYFSFTKFNILLFSHFWIVVKVFGNVQIIVSSLQSG